MNFEKLPLITIIVPVYNVEEYLDRCMATIVSQTYQNIEIILVDDGSTDSSGKLCDKYAGKDDRIKVIHQSNQGLSGARNSALNVMKGDYVIFVDSDDEVDVGIVKKLYENIVEFDCDIAESNFVDIYGDSKKVRWHKKGKILCDTEKALEYDISGVGGVVSACGKLYKRGIFSEVRFPMGKIGEDGYSIVDIVSKAKNIVIDNRPMYLYYHRKDSITTHNFSEKYFDNIRAYERNYKLVRYDYPGAADAVLYRLDWSYLDIVDRILVSDDWKNNKYLSDAISHIKNNKWRIVRSKYMRFKRKAATCILLVSKTLYRYIIIIEAKKRSRI